MQADIFILRESLFLSGFGVAAEAVFNVVVDDEIQLLRREPVVPRQHPVDLVEDACGAAGSRISA